MTPILVFAAVTAVAPAPNDQPPSTNRTLSLAEAERLAVAQHPSVSLSKAQTRAAEAAADQAFAPLLPQVTATASYQRATGNFVQRPGALPTNTAATRAPTFDTFSAWNFGLSATELIWDWGKTTGNYRSAQAGVDAQRESETTTALDVLQATRSAYFQAWAQRSLVAVANENLANMDRHLEQVNGFVTAGSRPEIDLAQTRADRANAALQLANARAGYETAKAQLAQAIGMDREVDFDVENHPFPAEEGEDLPVERMLRAAIAARPEMRALEKQADSQRLAIRAAQGAYGPSLGANANASEAGVDLTKLTWNFGVGATLTWQLFQGGLTKATVRAAEANEAATRAQLAQMKQQVRFDLTQALLNVQAAKVSVATAKEAEVNARERLRLAEGRYQAGAGSIIELQDAQVAETSAAAQVVQAEFSLSLARASMRRAMGRR
jgi:outer membrane protein